MNTQLTQSPEQLYAELYDLAVQDWDGEIDFYLEYAREAKRRGQAVLEVACGTGRVTLRLAQEGVQIVGTDLDEEMLKVARTKSEGLANVGWVRTDMRSFDLGQTFGLILIPGHSFQFMCTPADQVQALQTFKRHLTDDGILIIHINHDEIDWLGDLVRDSGGKFSVANEITHPQSGHRMRQFNAWTFSPSRQTASVVTRWEETGDDGSILQMWERAPKALHCIFPFEMEHLLARAGFEERVVYGDFFKHPFDDRSPSMIWMARKS